VLGDDLPDDLQILPRPGDVRASMQKRASSNARPDGAQESYRNGQYSNDAYKACSRARVQEGTKTSPPPLDNKLEDTDKPQYETLEEEVRDPFASDALEEV